LLTLLLEFLLSLGNQLGIFSGLSLALGNSVLLDSTEMSLSLQCEGSHKALDLGGLGTLGLALLLGELTANDVLSDIILLGEVEELSDVGGSLGAQSAGNVFVGQTGKLSVSLLHNNNVEGRDISSNNASTNRLALSLSSTTRSVAFGSLAHKKSNSGVCEDSLLHGETLLVISTSNLEDVSLEFVSKSFTFDFLRIRLS